MKAGDYERGKARETDILRRYTPNPMQVLFQDYFVVGSLVISGIGTAMLVLHRWKYYEWAARLSVVGLYFPIFYMLAPFVPGLLVIEWKFGLFEHAPLLMVGVLNLVWAYPTFVGDLRGDKLVINYALLSAATFVGAIYALPALFSFTLSLGGSLVFAGASYSLYKSEKRRATRRKLVVEAIESRGAAGLEEIMDMTRMNDFEVDAIVHDLWLDDVIERDEDTRLYKVKRDNPDQEKQ